MNPVSFRSGDIVEIEFAFVGIPVANDKVWFTMALRGLTLLDNTFTRVSGIGHDRRNALLTKI